MNGSFISGSPPIFSSAFRTEKLTFLKETFLVNSSCFHDFSTSSFLTSTNHKKARKNPSTEARKDLDDLGFAHGGSCSNYWSGWGGARILCRKKPWDFTRTYQAIQRVDWDITWYNMIYISITKKYGNIHQQSLIDVKSYCSILYPNAVGCSVLCSMNYYHSFVVVGSLAQFQGHEYIKTNPATGGTNWVPYVISLVPGFNLGYKGQWINSRLTWIELLTYP